MPFRYNAKQPAMADNSRNIIELIVFFPGQTYKYNGILIY